MDKADGCSSLPIFLTPVQQSFQFSLPVISDWQEIEKTITQLKNNIFSTGSSKTQLKELQSNILQSPVHILEEDNLPTNIRGDEMVISLKKNSKCGTGCRESRRQGLSQPCLCTTEEVLLKF